MVWARISYDDRAWRAANQSLIWAWQPSKSLGSSAVSLANTLRYHYSAPGDYCYDAIECNGGEAINSDPTLEGYNADVAAAGFIAYLQQYTTFYRGNDLLVLFGDDFNYEEAESYYINLDKLIAASNALQPGGPGNASGFNIFYSSPAKWAAAALDGTTSYPLRTDDLFSYADGPHSYWAGYFTSRAALKGYIRSMTGAQTSLRQLQAAAGGVADVGPANGLYLLERAVAVAQHHDAVAGTSQQHVANDYAKRLATGFDAAVNNTLGPALATLTKDASLSGSITVCTLANVTICPTLEAGQATAVFISSPYADARALPQRLPVAAGAWTVTGPDGKAVPSQLLPISPADSVLRSRYGAGTGNGLQWLAFIAPVPAAGYATYFLTPAAAGAADAAVVTEARPAATGSSLRFKDQTISNGIITLTISGATGQLSGYANAANGVNTPITHSFLGWLPNIGDKTNGQTSGAYIFRPATQTPLDPSNGTAYTLNVATGPVVSEVWQSVPGLPGQPAWLTQVIRLWAGAQDVEVEWTVGPIPIYNQQGFEVISRYGIPGAVTNGAWATDSNCREFQPRVRNQRQSWNLTLSEPVAQNYFPVNCAIQMADAASGAVLSVVTDRSQGGSSMVDGTVELMLHRRMLKDDGRGVGVSKCGALSC